MIRNLSPLCCVLGQDTLPPETTSNTQEAVAPSRHDLKILTGTLNLNTNKILSIHSQDIEQKPISVVNQGA